MLFSVLKSRSARRVCQTILQRTIHCCVIFASAVPLRPSPVSAASLSQRDARILQYNDADAQTSHIRGRFYGARSDADTAASWLLYLHGAYCCSYCTVLYCAVLGCFVSRIVLYMYAKRSLPNYVEDQSPLTAIPLGLYCNSDAMFHHREYALYFVSPWVPPPWNCSGARCPNTVGALTKDVPSYSSCCFRVPSLVPPLPTLVLPLFFLVLS